MTATLYLPHQSPKTVSGEELNLPDSVTGFVGIPNSVALLLNCAPALVDVLASGPGYVAYSIFDCEGEINQAAMNTVTEVTGAEFDEDAVLRGAILIITSM